MATIEEIKPGRIFRHKGGKLYKVRESGALNSGSIRWGRATDETGAVIFGPPNEYGVSLALTDKKKVWAVQWQVNEKHPHGREFQADRELKISDLTAID